MLQPPHVLLQLDLDPLDLRQLRLQLIYLQKIKQFSYIQLYIPVLQPPHILLQLVLDPLDLRQLRLQLIYLQK